MNWQPIHTAPWDEEVMLTGESYAAGKNFIVNGMRRRRYHDPNCWVDVEAIDLAENGWRPTHWAPVPKLP